MAALGALKNLLNSEKAFAGGVLIVCATVLAALGQMSVEAWQEYTTWIFGIYVFGKTTQGAVSTLAASSSSSSSSPPASTTPPAPAKKAVKKELPIEEPVLPVEEPSSEPPTKKRK